MDITLTHVIFIVLAGVTLAAAVAVVTLKNLLRSALALALTLIGVASIYFLLQAEFIAVVQILIYVGAVMVLILFAIMLTERLMETKLRQFNGKWWLVAPLALALFGLIAMTVTGTDWLLRPKEAIPEDPVAALGSQLVTQYALPFEVASVLLLAALIGAIVIAWPARDRLPAAAALANRLAMAKTVDADVDVDGERTGEPEPGPVEEEKK